MATNKPYGRYFEKPVPQRTKAELYGLVQGVLADGYVVEEEARTILRWIERNDRTKETWPVTVLNERINAMLVDGVLDADEQKELLRVLTRYLEHVESFGSSEAPAARPCLPTLTLGNHFERPVPEIQHRQAHFVITGDFAIGTRPFVTNIIESRGGNVCAAVSKKINYVIVGEFGSEDWVGSNWGTKIEKAVALRQQGLPVYIVEEQHWATALERAAD